MQGRWKCLMNSQFRDHETFVLGVVDVPWQSKTSTSSHALFPHTHFSYPDLSLRISFRLRTPLDQRTSPRSTPMILSSYSCAHFLLFMPSILLSATTIVDPSTQCISTSRLSSSGDRRPKVNSYSLQTPTAELKSINHQHTPSPTLEPTHSIFKEVYAELEGTLG